MTWRGKFSCFFLHLHTLLQSAVIYLASPYWWTSIASQLSLLHTTYTWDFTSAAAPFLRHIEEGVLSQTVSLRSYSTLLQSSGLLCLPHPKPPKLLRCFADLMSRKVSVWFSINSLFEASRITLHVWDVNSAPCLSPPCGDVHFLIHFLQLLVGLLISDMRWKLFSGLFSCFWTCLYFLLPKYIL